MSVQVQHLVKVYGSQRAVDDVSFEVQAGEVLGFLGPNGAGKTTTMKIITGFLPATSGTVRVCGYDVASQPMQARACVGYLPEHNPLYRDMYVREYLKFVASVHRLSDARTRVEAMIERTGLTSHRHKRIGELSKGYRQRVGLAQAMLHDPQVLILDEPTSGLDPNQIVEIRQLIKELGREKTVILSTHILAEVEAVCSRAIIIHQGRLVADDAIEALKSRLQGRSVVTVEFGQPVRAEQLRALPHVQEVKALSQHRWQLIGVDTHDLRPILSAFAAQNQLTLLELHKEILSVEEVFQQLTR